MAVLKYYNTATSAWEYIAASTTANFTTWKKTAAGGETSVSGTDDNAVTLSYTVGLEQVFINGVLQVRGSDYTATDGTSVTGLAALVASDIVTVVCYAPFNVANTIAPTVVDAKGDLIAGTAADTVGRLAVGSNGQMLVADSTASTGLAWVAPGMLLQVVNATTSTDTSESAGNYADVTGLTANITPLYSNSKIIVMVSVNGVHKTATGNFGVSLRLMRGATQLKEFSDAFGYGMTTSADAYLGSSSYTHYDSPATTSSTTYKVQLKTYGTPNTASVNKANSESSITLMEIRQ